LRILASRSVSRQMQRSDGCCGRRHGHRILRACALISVTLIGTIAVFSREKVLKLLVYGTGGKAAVHTVLP
jgi:hypothetical protein